MNHLVSTELFSGPLDLLLELIERRRLDISTIALSEITGEYIERLQGMDDEDPTSVAAFLHVASRLVLLKSRYLLQGDSPEEEEDGEISLAEQLRLYGRYRAAAEELAILQDGGGAHGGKLELPAAGEFLPIAPEEFARLAEIYAELVAQALPIPESDIIPLPRISVAERSDELRRLLARNRLLDLHRVFADCASKSDRVITFLAVLDILRHGSARVRQETAFAVITLEAA